MQRGLVGSEMCIRDSYHIFFFHLRPNFFIQLFIYVLRLELQLHYKVHQIVYVALMMCQFLFFDYFIYSVCPFLFSFVLFSAPSFFFGPFLPLLQTSSPPMYSALIPVSYTHLTLPTILLVQISVVVVSLKKKILQQL
eukprot:TRINITY_DN61932_c0_g1_i1.p1 TRINITY_DN61932_c0_g1~~TRINITY_DN61932_c0_g1_i1.p1  ORF type:complete len:138 (-),score=12.28 TRINITY_DN61932_c0_g1_i1:45-458(-)